jgi:hypothetical protein
VTEKPRASVEPRLLANADALRDIAKAVVQLDNYDKTNRDHSARQDAWERLVAFARDTLKRCG